MLNDDYFNRHISTVPWEGGLASPSLPWRLRLREVQSLTPRLLGNWDLTLVLFSHSTLFSFQQKLGEDLG